MHRRVILVGHVIFLDDEDYPAIAVRVGDPDFVLKRIAAHGVVFFEGRKTGCGKALRRIRESLQASRARVEMPAEGLENVDGSKSTSS